MSKLLYTLTINKLTPNLTRPRRIYTSELVSLKVDESTLTDDLSIAESMNSYFSSVFTTEEYDNFPSIEPKVVKKLSHIHCSTKEVEALLRNLNTYKSPGPDHIPPRILKECAKELAPSLCALLNRSFSSGQLPSAWKLANITPIHKKGPKNFRENYRQISLTSIVCKLGEKIVKDRLVNFWPARKIIFTTGQRCVQRRIKDGLCTLLITFDARQRFTFDYYMSTEIYSKQSCQIRGWQRVFP